MPQHRRPRGYNLARVFALRDRLSYTALVPFAGVQLDGRDIDDMAEIICQTVPNIPRHAVWQSIHHAAGRIMTPEALHELAWRIAGNVDRLRAGTPVPPWMAQREPEWMPVQVLAWRSLVTDQGPRQQFTMRILAGTGCPLAISVLWRQRFAYYVAGHAGYSRRRGKHPLVHVSELVGLRLQVHVTPERCMYGQIGFDDVACTAGALTYNRAVIRKRFREGWACPYNYVCYCYQCHVGYDQCPAATHSVTYDPNTQQTQQGVQS